MEFDGVGRDPILYHYSRHAWQLCGLSSAVLSTKVLLPSVPPSVRLTTRLLHRIVFTGPVSLLFLLLVLVLVSLSLSLSPDHSLIHQDAKKDADPSVSHHHGIRGVG